MREIEILLPDYSARYEFANGAAECLQLCKMHGGIGFASIKPGEPKWEVLAHRSSASVAGAASGPLRIHGHPAIYATKHLAATVAARLNETRSQNVIYSVRESK